MVKKILILIGFLLVLLSSVSAYDNNLTIPDNYYIVNETDNFTIMQSDDNHSISICSMDNDTDRDLLKYLLEKSMYDFTYSSNYIKGDFDIEENHYNQEYQRGILYLCNNGDELIVIDYKVPLIEEIENSPVGIILDGLE